MIVFRTLGGLDLKSDEIGELASILAHSKRTALLAYLAIAAPRGFHRRDTLLGLLWPELDQDRARASLRKAIHHLRRALGDDVLVGRGEEELGLDATRFSCDAAKFDAAAEAGQLETALELYRGPLMPGFFLPDAPEFESWLERERARLRDAAFAAAWRLADAARSAGNNFGAGHWARHAVSVIPDDEEAVRRVIALLGDIGDRAGAVSAYEEFARRLHRDLDVEPSAETVALVERVRRTERPEAPTVEARSAKSPSQPSAERAVPLRSMRPPRAAVLGIGLLALVVAGAVTTWDRTPKNAAPASVVAVLPFSYRGAADLAYVGEGMADLLETALNGAGDLRTVDSRAVLAAARARASQDPASARVLAEKLGAGRFILGDIVEANGRLRMEASLYDAPAVRTVARATAEGPADSVFHLVDVLSAELLAGATGGSSSLTRLATQTTSSLPALRAYLQGESAYRRGLFDRALDAFTRATQDDSTFALAWYRLSLTAEWFSRGDLERDAAEHAVRYANRLSDHNRLLLQASLAWRRGDASEAERLYQTAVGGDPTAIESWMQLGEVWFHYGPLHGRSISLARPAWERALAYEPDNVLALYHLARTASFEGKTRELDTLVRLVERLTPESERALEMRALRAFQLDDTAQQKAVLHSLSEASDNTLIITARSVLTYSTNLARTPRIAELLTAPRRSAEVRALGHVVLAHLAGARGLWREAEGQIALVKPLVPAWYHEYRAYLLLSPAVSVPAETLRAARSEIDAWKAAETPPSITPGLYVQAHDSIHAELRQYLLGALSARLGDDAAANRAAAALDGVTGSRRAFARSLAARVRAQLAWQHGDARKTLDELDHATLETIYDLTNNSPFQSQARERFLRAEALAALGQDREALRWYASLGEVSPYELIYLAPALSRRAEIYAKLGDPRAAAALYARLVSLLHDSDPEQHPERRRAETRLAQLSSIR